MISISKINANYRSVLLSLTGSFFHRWDKHMATEAHEPVIEVTHTRELVGNRRPIRHKVGSS